MMELTDIPSRSIAYINEEIHESSVECSNFGAECIKTFTKEKMDLNLTDSSSMERKNKRLKQWKRILLPFIDNVHIYACVKKFRKQIVKELTRDSRRTKEKCNRDVKVYVVRQCKDISMHECNQQVVVYNFPSVGSKGNGLEELLDDIAVLEKRRNAVDMRSPKLFRDELQHHVRTQLIAEWL